MGEYRITRAWSNMRLVTFLTLFVTISLANAQFFNAIRNLFSPVTNLFNGGGRFVDDGTQSPQATGREELFPSDCGRDTNQGTGKLCFPDGLLCKERVNKGGVQRFNGHLYWFSWQDNDNSVRNAKWDWFNARNYCRKRCMDLVSFETREEYEWVKGFINVNVPYFWTSGRLCDFDGCDRPDFFPKNINGWFWSANQARLAPTDSKSAFHDCPPPEGSTRPAPSPTTGRRPSREERLSLAWLCSITSTETASNGTMLLATTRSRSSARMWRATSPSPGRPSPTSGSPPRAAASNTIYL